MTIYEIKDLLMGTVAIKHDETRDFALAWRGEAEDIPYGLEDAEINTIEPGSGEIQIYIDSESIDEEMTEFYEEMLRKIDKDKEIQK